MSVSLLPADTFVPTYMCGPKAPLTTTSLSYIPTRRCVGSYVGKVNADEISALSLVFWGFHQNAQSSPWVQPLASPGGSGSASMVSFWPLSH